MRETVCVGEVNAVRQYLNQAENTAKRRLGAGAISNSKRKLQRTPEVAGCGKTGELSYTSEVRETVWTNDIGAVR